MTLSTRLASPQARARARWEELSARLRTITPEAVGRGVLTLSVIALVLWLSIASWPALAPFVIGAVIAYAVLPIANRLDRFMPRVLAALLAELVALAILGGIVLVVVPPLLQGLVDIALHLPTEAQVQASLDELQANLGQLPDPVGGIVLAVATEAAANLQTTINGVVEGAGAFVANQILGIFGTLTFLLGLLVIPAWVLTVVADERSIKRRGTTLIAPAIRADVYALFRIVDRAFGTFLRVRVLLAILVGVLIWFGLTVVEQLGVASYRFEITAATLLGALQLIPELGFFLGFFPILLVLVVGGPVPAALVAVVYVLAVRIASPLVETRVSRGVLDVHPGLLIPAIVVLSQFGALWLLAAAPVVAILRDSVRYLAGRLAEPPKPAGVLPGERPRRSPTAAGSGLTASVPSVYRMATPPSFTPTAATATSPDRRAAS